MKKTVLLLVSSLMFGISASAMADSNHWNHYAQDRHQGYQQHRYDNRHDHRDQPRWSNANRGHRYDQRIVLKRGERLPAEFRTNRYVVSNFREHRLNTPPRGYRWMQLHNHYVLVDSKYKIYRVA
ncbi:MAG TPA: RcnB family protein [Acinetobacter sp.]|jgi:Ni/Co efflux regulator RcnB|nr:RcnB family protein [Acinetobacter sp.]